MLIEKAYAQSKGGYDDIEWGNTGVAMEAITGKDSTQWEIAPMSRPALEKLIQDRLAAGEAVAARNRHTHVYAVMRLHRTQGTIRLHSPTGSGHLPALALTTFMADFTHLSANPT